MKSGNNRYELIKAKRKMPFSKRDLFVSVQNSVRFERFLSGAHKYR